MNFIWAGILENNGPQQSIANSWSHQWHQHGFWQQRGHDRVTVVEWWREWREVLCARSEALLLLGSGEDLFGGNLQCTGKSLRGRKWRNQHLCWKNHNYSMQFCHPLILCMIIWVVEQTCHKKLLIGKFFGSFNEYFLQFEINMLH